MAKSLLIFGGIIIGKINLCGIALCHESSENANVR